MIDVLRRASHVMTWIVGAALIATAGLVAVEVVLRKVFLIGLSMGTEISSYVLAVVSSWGFAFALFNRAHVRVDALVRLLPLRGAAWADVLALAGLTGFAAALTFHGYVALAESWLMDARAMTPLATRLWIPQGLWVLGLIFFTVSAAALLGRALYLLVRGHAAATRELIGTASMEDEGYSEVKEFIEDGQDDR